MEIKLTPVNHAILTLLRSQSLPIDDLEDNSNITLFAASAKPSSVDAVKNVEGVKCIFGVVGIEHFDTAALLRSLATDPNVRGKGYAKQLVAFSEHWAKEQGIGKLYLLTTTADKFFSRLGYSRVSRELAPAEIMRSRQFSSLCPGSAILMMKEL